MSIRPRNNCFVSPDGRWIGSYIPAHFRSYPFALTKVQRGGYLLCADADSDLIGAEHNLPIYEADGELAQPVKEVLDFLQQVERNRAATLRLCATLDAEGLIVPWGITINGKDGQAKINDLYRIDEAKLSSLDPAALARLHQAGALPVAYCQLISMQHIHTLAKLADAHAKIEAHQQEAADGSSGPEFFGSDGKIDFSGLN